MIRIFASCICAAALLSGCFSLRSEYPDISYYRLEQKSSIRTAPKIIDGTLSLRKFSISGEYDTEYLLKIKAGTEVERFYYHRWIDDPADMLSNFLLDRYLDKGFFKGGVVRGATQLMPEYFLEGRILEMAAFSEQTEDGPTKKHFVRLRVHITFLHYKPGNINHPILLQKTYEKVVERRRKRVESVADAFSIAVSEFADDLMIDMVAVVR